MSEELRPSISRSTGLGIEANSKWGTFEGRDGTDHCPNFYTTKSFEDGMVSFSELVYVYLGSGRDSSLHYL